MVSIVFPLITKYKHVTIMKKIAFLIVTLLLFNFTFSEDFQQKKKRNAQFSDLPVLSQQFIKQYFATAAIDYITVIGDRKAEVDLADGTELEFGRGGYWSEIENEKGLLLDNLKMLPGQMLTSLKNDFGEYKIITVDRKDLYYKVELEGRNDKEIEIRYDLNGQYLF